MTDTSPPAWPWLTALDADDLPHLLADLREAADAGPDAMVPELNRLAAEWAETIATRQGSPVTAPDDALARLAYRAYGDSTGGRNYRGEPMPAWDQLGDTIRAAWIAAVGPLEHLFTEKHSDAWRPRVLDAIAEVDPAALIEAVNAASLGPGLARCGECYRTYVPTARNTTGFCSWACFDEEVREGAPEAFHAFLPKGTEMVQIEPEAGR